MKEIKSDKILYIKLGEGGKFEKECIEQNQTLKLSFRETDHNLCVKRNWGAVHSYFLNEENKDAGTSTRFTNELKQFYLENENTLWVTFYLNKLWWCFSKPEITLLEDGTKTRPVIGRWSDADINGNVLLNSGISGKLLKTQGYRGTICRIKEEHDYTLNKINEKKNSEVIEVEEALQALKSKLKKLIQTLSWKDFEILVDLIFRQEGWQRISANGETQKTLDLELFAPVTGERAIVQIKSQADKRDFEKYQKDFFDMKDYDKFFFIVHSPKKDLERLENNSPIKLFKLDKVTDLTISAGLVDWVIKKTS